MRKKLNILIITLISAVIILFPINAHAESTTPGVAYKTHVQTYGWQGYVSDGALSGTVGLGKRLEAINIKGTNLPEGAHIEYEVQVQTYGWNQGWIRDDQEAGTHGQSKRLEAIKIRLVGMPGYSVEYKVQVQTFGWQGWVKDGALSGTVGLSKRLEAIQIKIVPDGYMDVSQSTIINDIYDGKYQLTINNIERIDKMDYHDNTNVAEVYKINYTYKLLARPINDYTGSLCIYRFDSVIDSSRSAGSADYDYGNPVDLSIINTSCTTDTYVSVSHVTTNLTLLKDYYNANWTTGHATFVVQTK